MLLKHWNFMKFLWTVRNMVIKQQNKSQFEKMEKIQLKWRRYNFSYDHE